MPSSARAPHVPDLSPFVQQVERAHAEARRVLDSPRPMEAVAWLASHLAAVDRVVYPVAAQRLTGGRLLVRQQRRAAHELQHLLRLLEQALAGDAWAGHVDTERLLGRLRQQVDRHAAGEHEVLSRLAGVLSGVEQQYLVRRFDECVQRAPTRPHLVVPHAGPLGALAFRLDALRDRILDAMDGRHTPTPRRAPHQHRPGRWGHYALGRPEFDELPPDGHE